MNTTHTTRATRATIAALLALALVGAAVLATGCGSSGTQGTQTTQPEQSAPQEQPGTTEGATTATDQPGATGDVTKLKIEDTKVGKGAAAKKGDTVVVDYTGYLTDGTKFDSSIDSGVPFEFQLGSGMVIPGWDEGLVGMKVGGERKLTIPPDMAYGAQGSPPVIPPNATLVFDVKMIKIK